MTRIQVLVQIDMTDEQIASWAKFSLGVAEGQPVDPASFVADVRGAVVDAVRETDLAEHAGIAFSRARLDKENGKGTS